LFALALIVIAVGANLPSLDGWWGTDDPQILLHAIRNTPFETLASSAAWQTLSTSSFTPLVTLSFEIDRVLFGLRPLFYYQHQLLAIAVCVLLLYLLLEPVTGRPIAFLTAAAAGAGPAMALAAESLMIRHYVEGLALALAALVVWRSGEPDRIAPGREIAAAILYLLAMLAKEIYAPLPLLFLADGLARRVPLRATLARLVPASAAAAVYLVWRTAMLGAIGGYGDAAAAGSIFGAAWHLYQRLHASSPVWIVLGVPVLALVAIVAALRVRPRATALVTIATFVALALPLVPVAGLAEARYAFLPGIAAVVLVGLGLAQWPRRAAVAAGVLLLVLQAVAGFHLHESLEEANAHGVAEGRYVWEEPASAPPLLAQSPAWYLTGLRELRQRSGDGAAPPFYLSREALLVGAVEPEEVVQVRAGGMPYRDPDLVAWILDARARFDGSIAASVSAEREGDVIRWNLSPQAARFTWLTVPEYDEYSIPPAGSRRIPEPVGPQHFRILVEVPGADGRTRWNVTPVLEVPSEGEVVRWP
ncbi:MAG: hypothetical protein ACRD2J_05840, partial [Thermoanaerobaculia bacterium]